MNMTRREFVFCCSAALISAMSGASGAILPQKSRAGAFARRKRSYSVPVLGDIHFDSPDSSSYHSDYTHSTSRQRYEAHLAEHVRNAEMWKERLPRLIRASGTCLASDAAFALQVGDLVQGDCGNAATHKRMLDDAFSFVKNSYGGDLPLVVVTGGFAIAHSWRPVQQLERIHLERVRPRLEDVASHLRHGRGSLDFQAPSRLCRFQAPHGSPPQTAYFQRRQLRTAGMISRSRRKAKGFE